jgi:cellobiose phosphorylase
LDQEFFESLLVPQILLRGFLGLSPTADGFSLEPKLPSAFPALTIGPIRLKNITLKITVSRQEIVLEYLSGKATQLFTVAALGYAVVGPIDWDKTPVVRLKKI